MCFWGDHIKEDDMGEAYCMVRRDKKFAYNFGQKTQGKDHL
jgi:hypothetical protein